MPAREGTALHLEAGYPHVVDRIKLRLMKRSSDIRLGLFATSLVSSVFIHIYIYIY